MLDSCAAARPGCAPFYAQRCAQLRVELLSFGANELKFCPRGVRRGEFWLSVRSGCAQLFPGPSFSPHNPVLLSVLSCNNVFAQEARHIVIRNRCHNPAQLTIAAS